MQDSSVLFSLLKLFVLKLENQSYLKKSLENFFPRSVKDSAEVAS